MPSDTHTPALETNLRWITRHQSFAFMMFWTPVFMLYFSSLFSLTDVLRLEAIYYFSVFALEIPSGYFSDKIGRRPTLMISNLAGVVAYSLFFLSSTFFAFASAQVFLAMWMAFRSGTDSSLLYDTLHSLNRSDDYAKTEARIHWHTYTAYSLAAFVGGVSAGFALKYAYALSIVSCIAALVCSIRITEPPRSSNDIPQSMLQQLKECVACWKDSILLWVFFYAIVMIVFLHIPYMFFQPYVDLVLQNMNLSTIRDFHATPVVTGIMVAIIQFSSALAGRYSIAIMERVGVFPLLLGSFGFLGIVLLVMGLGIHPIVLLLCLLRSTPFGFSDPVMKAMIHPRLHSGIRATYMSIQSLAGRLTFAAALLVTSSFIGKDSQTDAGTLTSVLSTFSLISFSLLAMLTIWAVWLRYGRGLNPLPSPASKQEISEN